MDGAASPARLRSAAWHRLTEAAGEEKQSRDSGAGRDDGAPAAARAAGALAHVKPIPTPILVTSGGEDERDAIDSCWRAALRGESLGRQRLRAGRRRRDQRRQAAHSGQDRHVGKGEGGLRLARCEHRQGTIGQSGGHRRNAADLYRRRDGELRAFRARGAVAGEQREEGEVPESGRAGGERHQAWVETSAAEDSLADLSTYVKGVFLMPLQGTVVRLSDTELGSQNAAVASDGEDFLVVWTATVPNDGDP